jgi:hypothetical protein
MDAKPSQTAAETHSLPKPVHSPQTARNDADGLMFGSKPSEEEKEVKTQEVSTRPFILSLKETPPPFS